MDLYNVLIHPVCMVVSHGGTGDKSPLNLTSRDTNANCPPDFREKKYRSEFTKTPFLTKNSIFFLGTGLATPQMQIVPTDCKNAAQNLPKHAITSENSIFLWATPFPDTSPGGLHFSPQPSLLDQLLCPLTIPPRSMSMSMWARGCKNVMRMRSRYCCS